MKKLLSILLVAGIVAFVSCVPSKNDQEAKEKAKQDSIAAAKKAKKEADSLTTVEKVKKEADSLAAVEKAKADSALAMKTIRISKYYTTDPNSAGGVDCNIIWQNKSEKTIKYAIFTVEPYNAVGDVVRCTIRDRSEFTGKVTGPIAQNGWNGYGSSWENVWYNFSIIKMKIKEVNIEYMDGSTITINENIINYVIY